MKSLLATLSVIVALTLSGCAEGSKASSDVTVQATDSACEISPSDLAAGPSTFTVTNSGTKVTEFYVYDEDEQIMGEVENIGPGLSRKLIVDLPEGTYEGACKPGMVGDGIRTTITVTGDAA